MTTNNTPASNPMLFNRYMPLLRFRPIVDLMQITRQLSTLTFLLLALPLFAQETTVPDFSKGIPNAKLNVMLGDSAEKAFVLTTALHSKEFSSTLGAFLGEGWVKRVISQEKRIPLGVGSLDPTSVTEVNMSAYENPKIPGVTVEVMYINYKEMRTDSSVTILVKQPGPFIRAFGSSISPDGKRRLEVTRRDKDLVDFRVLDSASGKILTSDSIGWSAMRWCLYWENPTRLWGYGSDIQYFKVFAFKADGTVTETEMNEMMPVPSVMWDFLPSSLKKKYKKEQNGID